MSAEEQAAELFGQESSSGEEEEEDSSEESSGEPENETEHQQQGEVVGGEGSREGGEGEKEEDSSSSGESGSGSEAEENEEEEEGAGGVASPWKQEPPSEPSWKQEPPSESSWKQEPPSNSEAELGGPTGGPSSGSDVLANTQNLFGETSSSSSSDSEDGGADVIGVGGEGGGESESEGGGGGGGESDSEGEEEEEEVKGPPQGREEGGEMGGVSAGIETMESEDGASQSEDPPSQTVEGLFGDAGDLSSSDSDDGEEGREGEGEVSEVVRELEGDMGEAETEVPRINVEIPRCTATLGTDLFFVKLPNFLSVETRPFDPALYEDEVEDENEILDEEGRARLKLKVENTIRWRYSQDEGGNEVRESNARVVRWSDGTMSLYLGSEIFDIHRHPLQGEFSHLFVRQGTGLQGQAVFHSKLTFRPHSTDSQTHRKMTLSIADRFSKAQKIRVLPAVGLDPESQKKEKIKKEEERLRAAVRRENQQKRIRERNSQRGLTANYIEPDREDDDDDEGASVAAIKSSVRHRLSEARGGRGGGVWGGAESDAEETSGEEGVERLIRAKRGKGEARKRHLDLPEVDVTRKKQPRRLHSDESEESD